MNEDERRREILNAEAAIRELAGRMAQASGYASQADMARSALGAATRSIDELRIEFHDLMEYHRGIVKEESKSMNGARESLDTCSKDLKKAEESFEKRAKNLETFIEKKNQEFYELMDARLSNQSQDIDAIKYQCMTNAEHLENSVHSQSQMIYELVDAKLGNLLQDINTISDKLSFITAQTDALDKKILALQPIIEEISSKSKGFESVIDRNSGEILELKAQIIEFGEKLSSLEYGLHEPVDAKLGNLLQDINTISDKLSHVTAQNNALDKKILALQPIIEDLSYTSRGFENAIDRNSGEILELRTQIIDSNEKLSPSGYGFEGKKSGLAHRLRSAIGWS
jgi:chromosome segregation ATPase